MRRHKLRKWSWAILAILLASQTSAQLTAEERQGISDALLVGNMTPSDLSFPRSVPGDGYVLPLVQLALAKPLDGADVLLDIHARASTADSISAILAMARKDIFREKPASAREPKGIASEGPEAPQIGPAFPADYSPAMTAEVNRLVSAIQECNASIRNALGKLTPDEKRTLVETLPGFASDGAIKVVFGRREVPERAKLLAMLSKVNLAEIREAGQKLTLEVEVAVPKLRSLAKTLKAETSYKAKTGGIQVELTNQEGYRHTATDSALCIAFGPRSHFGGRYGAGIGYASVLIDLSKESQYDVPDASVGVGILGVGVAYVGGSRHTFRSRSVAFGAGLAGVGVFMTDGGQNLYDSISMAQGFGSLGIGVLMTKGGENSFRSRYLSQGAGKVAGVGWLITEAGRNQFRCGQLVKDSPDGYRSMAQGFGGGTASGLGGGMGLLSAKGGEDTYQGDSLCQGAGQFGGIGSAYNFGKEANWLANRRSQGAGIDAGGGYLFEIGSSGAFTLREGVGHGAGNNEGIGFGLLRGPHQVLAARDGKPGLGSERGVGLFVTDGDDNRIYGLPGEGVATRGTGSIGLYLGLGGGNRYLEGLADGQATLRDTWGVAYSTGVPVSAGDSNELARFPAPGSLPMPSDSEMMELTRDLPLNIGKLVGVGKPALAWIFKHRLSSLDRPDITTCALLVRATDGDELLPAAMSDPNIPSARNAFRIASAAKAKGCEATVATGVKRPGLEDVAAESAGILKVKDAVADLIPLAGSQDPKVAAAASIALAQIGDERGVSTAQALVGSDNLLVRKAALSLVARYPEVGLQLAKTMVASGDMRARMTGLELLGLIGTPEALDLAGAYLGDQNTGVRIQAALALDGRCPVKLRGPLLDLKRDQNALVRSVAARIDVGRG